MRAAMEKQKGQAAHKTDDESVKHAVGDHLKKANRLIEHLKKREKEEEGEM